MKQNKKKKHPSEDAFLTNNVASCQDGTGFVQYIPQDEFEAESFTDLINAPVTPKEKELKDSPTKEEL